jgi:hypothetical protein
MKGQKPEMLLGDRVGERRSWAILASHFTEEEREQG